MFTSFVLVDGDGDGDDDFKNGVVLKSDDNSEPGNPLFSGRLCCSGGLENKII